MMVLN